MPSFVVLHAIYILVTATFRLLLVSRESEDVFNFVRYHFSLFFFEFVAKNRTTRNCITYDFFLFSTTILAKYFCSTQLPIIITDYE